MLINDKTAGARLASPNNLMNRLASLSASPRKSAMSLFIPSASALPTATPAFAKVDIAIKTPEKEKGVSFNPFSSASQESPAQPTDELVSNADEQINLALAHNKALGLLNSSLQSLADKLDDVKAEKLPSVIAATSKVVESIRRERLEATKSRAKNEEVHYHFYTPQQKKVSDYDVIDISASAASLS